ncbi:MAG: hypothetical protein WCT85_00630 [Parachlamydiales bacterium]|jgi:hypothetical protein
MKIKLDKKKVTKIIVIVIIIIILYIVVKKIMKKSKENKGLSGKFPREAELSTSLIPSYFDKDGNPSQVIGATIFQAGQKVTVYGQDDKGCRITKTGLFNKPVTQIAYVPCKYLLYTN